MGIFRKFLSSKYTQGAFLRFCSTITKEYSVSPNGSLNVILPFNAVIKPLDVVNYPESDKVIIKCPEIINCNIVQDVINVFSNIKEYDGQITCEILAPIKSSININCHGDISIRDFLGEAIRLYSEHGNITLGSFNNDYVIATANKGNIKTEGAINAAKVEFKAFKNGNIYTSKLKCLGLHLQTESGSIETKSSYCDESYFVTKTGVMNLHNVHKHSKILFQDDGKLNMIGFNGLLDLKMKKGIADIQISEMVGRSSIEIKEKGQLLLKLSDSVLQNTTLFLRSNCCTVEDDIPHVESEFENLVTVKAKSEENSKLYVNAEDSVVTIKVGSWADMIEKRFKENVSNN